MKVVERQKADTVASKFDQILATLKDVVRPDEQAAVTASCLLRCAILRLGRDPGTARVTLGGRSEQGGSLPQGAHQRPVPHRVDSRSPAALARTGLRSLDGPAPMDRVAHR